jgi:hypothetical protein
MFPWSLIGTALKTGSEIYKNRSATKIAMSEAQLIHAEKMKRGEIEYSGKIIENQKSDWKDEFVLLQSLAHFFYWHGLCLQKMKRCNKRLTCIFKNYKRCLGG